MAKVRQLLKHVSIDVAKRTRRCRHNRAHRIEPGQPCLVVRDECGPGSRNYCAECSEPILKACAMDLRRFGALLYRDRFPPQAKSLCEQPLQEPKSALHDRSGQNTEPSSLSLRIADPKSTTTVASRWGPGDAVLAPADANGNGPIQQPDVA